MEKSDLLLVEEMFSLQKKFNDETNGECWVNGVTKEGRAINWKRCIYMESAELIDSGNWKHWKSLDVPVDYDNIKVEFIDLWHFVMSELMINLPVDAAASLIMDMLACMAMNETLDYDTIVLRTEHLMSIVLNDSSYNANKLIYSFTSLQTELGMSVPELYKAYLVKNTLNRFRQNNGYKEGTYIKIIDGIEDNVHMYNIADNLGSPSMEELYASYEEFYKEKIK